MIYSLQPVNLPTFDLPTAATRRINRGIPWWKNCDLIGGVGTIVGGFSGPRLW